MIFGSGTDIIETRRLAERLGRTEGLKKRIFTPREISACEAAGQAERRFAVLFAAKEAFLKAMGTGWSGGYRFQDIEIVCDAENRPEPVLHGKVKAFCEGNGISGVHLSLSVTGELADAVVVLEMG